jgi:hypothetical protein
MLACMGLVMATVLSISGHAAAHERGFDEALRQAGCAGEVRLVDTIGTKRIYRVTCRGTPRRVIAVICSDRNGCSSTSFDPREEDLPNEERDPP